jgi:type VI secretion system protein VasG
MNVNLRALINRLNDETRGAVESAAGLCLSRTHYDVEIEHFLMKLLDLTDTDAAFILKHYGIDRARLATDLTASIDRLKSGNARTPALSPSLVNLLSEAWMLGSVDHGASAIRTGHIIRALVSTPELMRHVSESTREFEKISPEELGKEFDSLTGDSAEETSAPAAAGPGEAPRPGGGRTPNLDQFTQDLTERARAGRMDPVLGRDLEIRQVVDILTRRRQNNPILVGEAGVGKTAVVEGFAQRLAQGDVPPVLRNVALRSLDLALLQAGAGVKGEFENRLKGLIEEVKSSPTPIILFIDEAHTMIGAGGAAGQGDAANLLKPALARGELRTIAATTWSEYKKYFEKDPALTRRFQVVKVEEPTEDVCMIMMRGVVPALEGHHNVRILDDGMDAAVRLSARYLSERQLPDKAVSVLDTACARLALGQNSTPAPVEDAQRRLADLDVQERVLKREMAVGIDHSERLGEIAEAREATQTELEALLERWDKERELVDKVRTARERLESLASGESQEADAGAAEEVEGAEESDEPEASEGAEGAEESDEPKAADEAEADEEKGAAPDLPEDPAELREELQRLTGRLEELQGEEPLIPVTVDAELVGQVISGWTGIPVGKMVRDDVSTALQLESHLATRIIGQDHALEVLSHRVRTSKAGIEDPQKPVGVFMFVGPSGVGKTETALAISDLMYGGERNLITINMSEFQEAHTVSTLKGSPPGYVGYGEGGVLTEAVRRRPYSVVLLDEVEKAHPDVLELFFQVFDKGRMDDGEGREIDFKNTIIVLTTNAGTDTIMNLTADPETMPDWQGLVKALKPELDQTFKPAFLGRMVIVPYFPVRDEALKTIVKLKLGKVGRRLGESHRIDFTYDDNLVDTVADRCTEVESGARNIDNILTNTLLPDLSKSLLGWLVEGVKPERVHVAVGDDGQFTYSSEVAN